MVDYTIYQLDESNLTISGGQQLDGVTQGDGSHLVGQTLTIDVRAWTPINITDNDANFDDNDGNQVLNGAQVIDGTLYASGTRVEAEYSFVVTDGTNSWTLVGFNVNNSNPSFGTIEGIAVVGGPGNFPPTGVPLSIVSSAEGPNFPSGSYVTPICLTAGTLIDTSGGTRAIETLREGDLVTTLDHGACPLRWIGRKTVCAQGAYAPILFRAGALGNRRDLMVSQRHRMLIEDWRAEYYFGQDRVLVGALHLLNGRDVVLRPGGLVTYVHLLFDAHEIISAEGAPCESLHPGDQAMRMLDPAARNEVLSLFPELEGRSAPRALAAPELRRHEGRLVA